MRNSVLIITAIILIAIISIIAIPYDLLDVTDVKDFSDSAKFFAGEYKAKLRTSHSILYGLLLSPYVKIAKSFFLLKFFSVIWLSLLILSVYYISNKNRRTLLLFIASPLVWLMAPWLSPLPLVALLFLWAYYFIKQFNKKEEKKYIVYAGLLIGLAAALWDTALYISFIFLLAFLYDKKFYFSLIFIISVIVGLAPKLIVDQIFFGVVLYSTLKHLAAVFAFALYGGIYNQSYSIGIAHLLITILFVPFFIYLFYKKKNFKGYKKPVIFITLTILFILTNPQIRLLITIMPIIIILLGETLDKKQFKVQLIIFIMLSSLVVFPYGAQIKYDTNGKYFTSLILSLPNLEFYEPKAKFIQQDLDEIAKEYPNQVFVVGNTNDNYNELAHFYWGDGIKEFISLEDYKLFLNNETIIRSERIGSNASSDFRREIWFEIGIGKNRNDGTDYKSIRYAIASEKNLELDNFKLIKNYRELYLFEKI